MNKNKTIERIESIIVILVLVVGILTLMMMGAEPTTWDEDGLYDYEHLYDRGNSGWYIRWIWVWSVVSLIGFTMIRKYGFNKKLRK